MPRIQTYKNQPTNQPTNHQPTNTVQNHALWVCDGHADGSVSYTDESCTAAKFKTTQSGDESCTVSKPRTLGLDVYRDELADADADADADRFVRARSLQHGW